MNTEPAAETAIEKTRRLESQAAEDRMRLRNAETELAWQRARIAHLTRTSDALRRDNWALTEDIKYAWRRLNEVLPAEELEPTYWFVSTAVTIMF